MIHAGLSLSKREVGIVQWALIYAANAPDQKRAVANCAYKASLADRWILMLGISLMMNYTSSKPDAAGETTETKTSGSGPVLSTP